jgi:Mu transposase, C-terminal
LLPVTHRSIQDYAINFESLHYFSADLHRYRGVNSGLSPPAAGRWEIRYDPTGCRSIFVRDHTRGLWIEEEWSLAKRTLAPFSVDACARPAPRCNAAATPFPASMCSPRSTASKPVARRRSKKG